MHASIIQALACVLLAATPVAAQAPNTLTKQESEQGWRLLFDGKTLNGWDARPAGRTEPGEKLDWSVSGGALVCGGGVASWLGTVDAFADYTLKLEFRGPVGVNSGIFLRSDKEGAPHRTGYELQIWNNQPAGFHTGSLVGVVKAPQPPEIRGGEWNLYEITLDGDHIVAVLNGETILDVRDSTHPEAGVVGLQCQPEQRIEFRNLKLLAR